MGDPNKAQQFLIPIQPATYSSQLGDRGAVNIILWWTNFTMSSFVVNVLSQLAARDMAKYLPKWEVRERPGKRTTSTIKWSWTLYFAPKVFNGHRQIRRLFKALK